MRWALISLILLLCVPARAGEILATVVDLKGRPIPNAVIFIQDGASGKFAAPAEPAVMDQVDKMFVPEILPVLAGTKVRFPNKDNIHHHVYSFSKAKKFDLPLYKGEPAAPIVLEAPGIVKLGCNIHDWMRGFIVVLPNPYFAQTDAQGQARLSLPAGRYQVAVWSDRLKGDSAKTVKPVTVGKAAAKVEFRHKFGSAYVAHQHPVSTY